ncbi:tyrosine--tRNA ligase [bacterium]|nr:tyrosine--tRNA ligase [bacterium]
MNDHASFLKKYPLLRGVEEVISRDELDALFSENRPLTLKVGVDPTSPEIHLGHAVFLRILRRFQDKGHKVLLVVGGFTALIGDPSGRDKTRPPLTAEQVETNTERYKEQVLLILDEKRTQFSNNGEWLGALTAREVLRLAGNRSLNRLLERAGFRGRLSRGEPIRLHELLYPLFQAHDSVVLAPDIEMGGRDQRPNFMTTRDAMKEAGLRPEVVLLVPLLVGLDGKKKMSKSFGNEIPLLAPAEEMFGGLMSLPDEPVGDYLRLLTDLTSKEIREVLARHPMEGKREMASEVVSSFHGVLEAERASAFFTKTVSEGEVPDQLPSLKVQGSITLLDLLMASGLFSSRGLAKRRILDGGVRVGDERVSKPQFLVESGLKTVLRVGKRDWFDLEVL